MTMVGGECLRNSELVRLIAPSRVPPECSAIADEVIA